MSTELPSNEPDPRSTHSNTSGSPLRMAAFIFFPVCVFLAGFYFLWLQPAMERTEDAAQKTDSAPREPRGELRSSIQQVPISADAFEERMVERAKRANREIAAVRSDVEELESVVVRSGQAVEQGSSDLGARIAAKVFEKADLIPVKNQAEALTKEIESLRENYDTWATLYKELLDGDRGKAIAADENLVDRFAIIDFPTVTKLNIQTWGEILPELLKPMQDALDRDAPSLAPFEGYAKRVDLLDEQIHEAAETIRRAQLSVSAIEKKTQPTRVTADTPTLREALEYREVRLGTEFQDKRAEEAEKNRDALAKLLADEDTKIVKAAVVTEIEAKQKRAALEARFQAAIPEIRSYLKPYIVPGYTQPQGRSMQRTEKSGPVSLSALRGTGALKVGPPDEYGQSLQTLVSVTTSNNDRPLMGFPSNVLPRKDLPYLRKVQSLLDEFGPLMVEKGMLAE